MSHLSVVIVCRNEASTIGNTLQSLRGITDDIVVFDNGSTDGTQDLARSMQAKVFEGSWEGFGKTKRKAIAFALHDWILSLDADEAIDEKLKQALVEWKPEQDSIVYDLSFKNFFGDKYLKYGEWGNDHHIRLFNRRLVNFDEAPVHESLVLPGGITTRKMKGYVLHRTVENVQEYATKVRKYAMLNAEKYFQQGKKATWIKMRLSPGFTFIYYYIFKRGFLDGHAGYICAKMTAWYTFLKYARLYELQKVK